MARNIVYFLGAGFSKTFGYPLTGEIMPEILSNLRENDLFQLDGRKTLREKHQEKDLSRLLKLLYPEILSIDPDRHPSKIPGIIEVLSFIEHSFFYNIPPHPLVAGENLTRLRYLLNRAIAELLLDYENEGYGAIEERSLNKFERHIREGEQDCISIITTNYDLIIDRMFSKEIKQRVVDYGISYRDIDSSELITPPKEAVIRLYKLHGSLNWLRCDLCGHYYINPEGSIAARAFDEKIRSWNTCDCSNRLQLKTVLVAPSLVRDIRDSNLLQVWKEALEAIRTAHKIIFIGYSLPQEDLAIKSLIMRGINGRRKRLPPLQVEVIQKGIVSQQNYRNLFGSRIKYNSKGLKDYLQAIKAVKK